MQNKAIVILGGGLAQDKKTGQWRTTGYNQGDNFGVQGDRLRVEAANYLFQDYPESTLITMGSQGQLKIIPHAPTVASVNKRELVELGVAVNQIISEEKSDNTYQQLLNLTKIINKQRFSHIKIISNEWHLPRIKAIINHQPELQILKNYPLISAEKVCSEHDKDKWQAMINKAYQSNQIKERIKLEQKGIQDIKQGKYEFR